MYGEEEYTLAGTSTEAPDQWPEKTDVVTVLNDVRSFVQDKNGQKITKLSISFVTTNDNPPKVAGKSKDSIHPITGATESNKYWTQQFLMALKIPVEAIQAARGVSGLIQLISQYKGRKYIMKASTNDAGYQNIQQNSVRPYIVPGTTEQATHQTQYGQPVSAPPAPAPAAAPVVDPWSTTPNPAGYNPVTPQSAPAPVQNVPDPWANPQPAQPVQNPTVAAGVTETAVQNTVTQPTSVAPATPAASPVKTPEQLEYEQFQAWKASQQAPATPQPTPAPQNANVEDEAKSFLAGLDSNDLTSSI